METNKNTTPSLAVITPVGPGHSVLVEQCRRSVQNAMQNPTSFFSIIEHILINDLEGILGPSGARNLGIKKAIEKRVDWLLFLDADDLLIPGSLEHIGHYLTAYEAIWGQIYIFNGNEGSAYKLPGQLEFTNNFRDILFTDPLLTIRTGHLLKRQVAIDVPFNEDMSSGEDFDHFLQIWTKYKCIKISQPICATRTQDQSARSEPHKIAERKGKRIKIIRKFKMASIHDTGKPFPKRDEYRPMDIALFGIMRSGTTLLADLLTSKDTSLILIEPILMNTRIEATGAELFEFEKIMKQLNHFGFDVSTMSYWDKSKFPTFVQFFYSNIYPLLSRLKLWGVKMIDFDDWEGFLTAFQPQKLILTVRDIRDIVISAFDLAIRLNQKFGVVVDEAWIERKTLFSCKAIMHMAGIPHLLVRYEDLCSNPDLHLEIAQYAGINNLSNNRSSFENISHRSYELKKHKSSFSTISINRYRSEPPGHVLELANRIWRLYPEYSARFGYETPPRYYNVPDSMSEDITISDLYDQPDSPLSLEFSPAYDRREALKALISMIPEGSIVLDLNCGTMSLESLLPEGCGYIPCDVKTRINRMKVCDFNRTGKLPELDGCTLIVAIGLVEYIEDINAFMYSLSKYGLPVILSYYPSELVNKERLWNPWFLKQFSSHEIHTYLIKCGFKVIEEKRAGRYQCLLHLSPEN